MIAISASQFVKKTGVATKLSAHKHGKRKEFLIFSSLYKNKRFNRIEVFSKDK